VLSVPATTSKSKLQTNHDNKTTTATTARTKRMPRAEIQTALASVPVSMALFDGINVTRVISNGKLKSRILTLSPNKFTLHVSSSRLKGGALPSQSGGGRFLLKPMLKKVASVGSVSMDGGADGERGQERSIDVGSIDRVQKGQTTLKFEQARKLLPIRAVQENFDPNNSLSIMFRGSLSLDLLVDSRDMRDELLDALRNLIHAYEISKVHATNEVLLMRYIWLDVDKDQSGTLDESELAGVLKRINYNVSRSDLKESCLHFAVKILGLDKKVARKGFTFDQAVTFLHKLRRDGPDAWVKKPLNELWEDLFGMTKVITHKHFLKRFLHEVQKEHGATLEYVTHVFRHLNKLQIASVATDPMVAKEPHKYLDKHRFEVYLNSAKNDIYDQVAEQHSPSTMNQPISHYWINSSHNTYLTGDQLSSYSSAEMYLNALYRGCRCVEVDVWNLSSEDKTPIVYHGHTITTKIYFKDTIESIRNFLHLNPNTYPIIISIENHCDIQGQEEMAEILVSILGERLYIPIESEMGGTKQLPSPEDLKGRVVLKGRRPPEGNYDVAYNDSSDENGDDSDEEELCRDKNKLLSPSSAGGSISLGAEVANNKKKKIFQKVSPDLARLTLFHGTGFNGWPRSIDSPNHHMHSFDESKIQRIFRKQEQHHCVIYNKGHISRVYPSGTRVGSTNYSPVLAWSMGCQLVALNFQTPDAPLRINDGFFRQNGNCGYVLKSRDLLDKHFHGEREDLQETLTIRVLSGSCLPKPKGFKKGEVIDPYVSVAVYDVVDEEQMGEVRNRYQTDHIQNNGFSPIWNVADFRFMVENESVAMLLFTVWDKDIGSNDDFIASASVPISCLREGYRSVKLFDAHNTRSGPFDFASLLVKVTREVIV
jgi:phosphatidylinositol phospholipase C delta